MMKSETHDLIHKYTQWIDLGVYGQEVRLLFSVHARVEGTLDDMLDALSKVQILYGLLN